MMKKTHAEKKHLERTEVIKGRRFEKDNVPII